MRCAVAGMIVVWLAAAVQAAGVPRVLPPPKQKGDGVSRIAKGEAAGYRIEVVGRPLTSLTVNALCLNGAKCLIGTSDGLLVWDYETGRAWREQVYGGGQAEVTGVFCVQGKTVVSVANEATLQEVYGRYQPVAFGAGARDATEEDAGAAPGALCLYLEIGSASLGAWKGGAVSLATLTSGQWTPVAMPAPAAGAEPTCLAADKKGMMLAGFRKGDRGVLLLSRDWGATWNVVEGLEGAPVSLLILPGDRVLMGVARGGAKVVNLKEKETADVPALAESGTVAQLGVLGDNEGIIAATGKGFVLLTNELKETARITGKNGLPSETVRSFVPYASYGAQGFLLVCGGKSKNSLAVLSKLPPPPSPRP